MINWPSFKHKAITMNKAKSSTAGSASARSDTEHSDIQSIGIRQVERLASARWSDFNTHDPGITTLEQIRWALTDLNYRLDHPIPDLLAENGSDAAHDLPQPDEALSCEPVTLNDLRRLLLDIKGVRHIWIEHD